MGKVKGLLKGLHYLKGIKDLKSLKNLERKLPTTKNMKEFGNTVWDKAQTDYTDALKYVATFKEPVSRVGKKIPKNINVPEMQKKQTLGKSLRSSLGGTADKLLQIGEGVKGKGVIGGTIQAGKNTGRVMKQQMKGDLYKEVFDPTVYKNNGQSWLKTRSSILKDRKVVSTTNRGSVIVRKRKGLTPVSLSFGINGPSIGAASYVLSDKEKPQSKRLTEAAVDTALFTVAPPVGLAVALNRGLKATQRKKQNETKQK